MTISSIDNKYLRLSSTEITGFLNNILDYTRIKFKTKYNCGTEVLSEDVFDSIETNKWSVSLTDAIATNEIIDAIILVNNLTGKEFNAITAPIDLAYVNENCASGVCKLEETANHFLPLFEDQINAFLLANSLSPSVSVSISDDIVTLDNIPAGFHFKEVNYVSSGTPAPAYFTDTLKDKFFIGEDGIYVKPSMFGQQKLLDGVYSISVKMIRENGYILEANCAFVDISTKCRVAIYLSKLLEEADINEKDTATIVHMMHYGLLNGSNCSCSCEDLCSLYNELNDILNAFNIQIPTDCGC